MKVKADKYYGLTELADILNVDRRTVRSSLEDKDKGGLPFMKVGGRGQIRVLGKDAITHWGSATVVSEEMQPESRID